ncbi:unnamed protein product, partial [Didymodactylos carnosus]
EIQAGCKGSMNDCEFGLDLDNSFFDDTGESDVEDVDPLESDICNKLMSSNLSNSST